MKVLFEGKNYLTRFFAWINPPLFHTSNAIREGIAGKATLNQKH